jgi:hypothetical protein
MEEMIRYARQHDGVRFVGMAELARWCLANREHFD